MTTRLSRKKRLTLQAKWTTSIFCRVVTLPLKTSLDSSLKSLAKWNAPIHLTNLMWIQEIEPASYNLAITNATATHTQKCMEEELEEKHKPWYICKGFLCSTTMNMRGMLDEQYYSQLKHINTAYRNTTLIQILEHLDSCRCPLNVQARKTSKRNSTPIGIAVTHTSLPLV